MKRAIVASLTGLALVISTSACSGTKPGPDELYLHYSMGTGDLNKFVGCIEPSTSGGSMVDDEGYPMPTSLRAWNILLEGGDSKDPIKTGTKPNKDNQPGPEVSIYTTVSFYLNTDCTNDKNEESPDSPIVRFWEQTGRRPWLNDGRGIASNGAFHQDVWIKMLQNTLVPAEKKALSEEARKYIADDLDANLNGVWGLIERQLGPLFLNVLRDNVGGDYFCGPGFTRLSDGTIKVVEWDEFIPDGIDEKGLPKFRTEKKKGKCPPVRISIIEINFANPDIAAARAKVFQAEQEAQAAIIKARSDLAVSILKSQEAANAAYLELRRIEAQLEAAKACAANPNCTLIVGVNANVNVSK